MGIWKGLANLGVTIAASIVLILLGIVYFMITIWIIKMGAAWAGFENVQGSTVVLTTGIITAAALIGSAIQK